MTALSGIAGWRLALRLAWRDAWRAKGRSALVLVMVTFPVIAVVAADVAQATSSVSSVEGLDRRLGSSEALVTAVSGHRVAQLPDPSAGGYAASGDGKGAPSWAQVDQALGGRRPAVEVRQRQLRVGTQLGVISVGATATDLDDSLTTGLFRLTSGRFPTSTDEVAVNAALAAHGFAVGDRMRLDPGRTVTVVGTTESTSERTTPQLVGALGLVSPVAGERQWLVGGAPVTWDDVRAVNQVGAIAVSRSVVEHPPSLDQLPPQLRSGGSSNNTQLYTVLALIGVMALLEVVLLAGPAFAVGARRQSRTLALLAANGGTPRQSRRTILASAVVLGSVGAVVGVVLGIVVGRAIIPPLQDQADQWFGPFQIRWDHVALVAAFGLLSALLAAVTPAWIASRQDVVAVLAGRRGDRKASLRWPFVGVALLVVGVVLAVLGARQGAGDLLIAAAAVVSVFGMIFLVPVVVVAVARLGRRFPLPLRYAVRDAARHRTRTVPAVAAVAATVAGVVALAIANTSDQAQAKAQYQALLAPGLSSIAMNGGHPDWGQVEQAVARFAPRSTATRVTGIAGSRQFVVRTGSGHVPDGNFMSSLPVQALVGDGTAMPPLLRGQVTEDAWRGAAPVLARGGAVVLSEQAVSATRARFSLGGRHGPAVTAPVAVLTTSSSPPRVVAVVSPTVARALEARVQTVGLVLTGPVLDPAASSDLQQVLLGMDDGAYLYTERGYQVPSSEQVVLWILFGLAGVLMLGGTLTATFLALSDARPDLATLAAVGAAPRTRRGVAAAYALSIGMVGAVLGAAVGFIPGIAITYPLTRGYLPSAPSHYLSIPWLLILGLVVALPVGTALVVGLSARSRLPLVARLD